MPSGWERLKAGLGMNEPEPEPQGFGGQLMHQIDEATTLTKTQRVYGFGISLGVGLLFGLLASVFWLMPTKFAILYTLANVFFLASTAFLMGPMAQLRKMFDKGRVVATLLYFLFMGLTLYFALVVKSLIGTLICLIIQMCALVWYCLSYIPFARAMASKVFVSLFE